MKTKLAVDELCIALSSSSPLTFSNEQELGIASGNDMHSRQNGGIGKQWDVFICHATEDKNEVAEPLAQELKDVQNLAVWYDKFEIRIGDSLTKKINEGLTKSRFGVVVFSRNFFEKHWPIEELQALHSRAIQSGSKVILPIRHNMSVDEVAGHYPLLGHLFMPDTSESISKLAEMIAQEVSTEESSFQPPSTQVKGQSLVDLQKEHSFNKLRVILNNVKAQINRQIKLTKDSGLSKSGQHIRVRHELLNGNTYHKSGNPYSWSAENISEEAKFLRDYVHPDLYEKITEIAGRTKFFGDPDEIFPGVSTIDTWYSQGESLLTDIDALILRLK